MKSWLENLNFKVIRSYQFLFIPKRKLSCSCRQICHEHSSNDMRLCKIVQEVEHTSFKESEYALLKHCTGKPQKYCTSREQEVQRSSVPTITLSCPASFKRQEIQLYLWQITQQRNVEHHRVLNILLQHRDVTLTLSNHLLLMTRRRCFLHSLQSIRPVQKINILLHSTILFYLTFTFVYLSNLPLNIERSSRLHLQICTYVQNINTWLGTQVCWCIRASRRKRIWRSWLHLYCWIGDLWHRFDPSMEGKPICLYYEHLFILVGFPKND